MYDIHHNYHSGVHNCIYMYLALYASISRPSPSPRKYYVKNEEKDGLIDMDM